MNLNGTNYAPRLLSRPNRFLEGFSDMAEVLTTKEAADFLKVHEKTLCRLARQGKVPGNKIGGEWRFMKNDLVRWIQNGNSAQTAASF